MEQWIYESFHAQLQHFHESVLKVYTKVVSYQIISSEFGVKLLGLLQGQLQLCASLPGGRNKPKGTGDRALSVVTTLFLQTVPLLGLIMPCGGLGFRVWRLLVVQVSSYFLVFILDLLRVRVWGQNFTVFS